jgi:DNA-binding NarL/FixJ family response regulator
MKRSNVGACLSAIGARQNFAGRQRLYREEMDTYRRIVSAEPEPQIAELEPGEEPLLTKRELEVLTRVADGKSNKEIALDLVISRRQSRTTSHTF